MRMEDGTVDDFEKALESYADKAVAKEANAPARKEAEPAKLLVVDPSASGFEAGDALGAKEAADANKALAEAGKPEISGIQEIPQAPSEGIVDLSSFPDGPDKSFLAMIAKRVGGTLPLAYSFEQLEGLDRALDDLEVAGPSSLSPLHLALIAGSAGASKIALDNGVSPEALETARRADQAELAKEMARRADERAELEARGASPAAQAPGAPAGSKAQSEQGAPELAALTPREVVSDLLRVSMPRPSLGFMSALWNKFEEVMDHLNTAGFRAVEADRIKMEKLLEARANGAPMAGDSLVMGVVKDIFGKAVALKNGVLEAFGIKGLESVGEKLKASREAGVEPSFESGPSMKMR